MSAASKARRRAALAALLVTALISLLTWQNAPFVRRLDNAAFDAFQRLAPRPYDPAVPVRIVAIDRPALERYGQWPWPRPVIAALSERLTAMGARAIGFDMVFSEPDRTSPEEIARAASLFGVAPALAPIPAPSHDAVFAEVLGDTPSVLGVILTRDGSVRHPQIKVQPSILGSDPTARIAVFKGADINRGILSNAAAGTGSVTLTPRDREDGIIRSVPLVSRIGDQVIPSFSLELLRVAQGAGGYLLRSSDAGGEIDGSVAPAMTGIRVGDMPLSVTADGGIWVRYSGSVPERMISAASILSGTAPDPSLRNRIDGHIVLVGATAPGLSDIVATPMSSGVPGVEVHAEVLEHLLSGDSLTRPDWAAGAERTAAWVLGILIALAILLGGYGWSAILSICGVAAIPMLSFLAFRDNGLILGPTIPMFAGMAAWSAGAGIDYLGARRERREIRQQFEHFVAPDVIEEIAKDPAKHMSPGGEERELSILFCDIRHFSSISSVLPPQELIAWLNGYLTPMTEVILAERGTIDKFIGDAIMAFWNAPRRDQNHARGAVRGALGLVEAAGKMRIDNHPHGLPAARIGIGVNTGPCSVGRIGAKKRLDYTCIGDSVNVASRLEGLTKLYEIDILIGEETAAQVSDFALIEIDRVEVLGRSDAPLNIFTVVGDQHLAKNKGFQDQRDSWQEALAAYRDADLDEAERRFANIANGQQLYIDLRHAAQVMLSRIAELRLNPLAESRDAVYRAAIK